ncbi:MAG TPA: phosphoribosylanthranilate isomerase [Alloacidobacterium sp.]|nr:phosphoribosylanthranilate isomerase [Alloacidobacterium sp.]
MWIKICANTNLEDAQLAVDAGANAVGFVFAASPRHVNVPQVAGITRHLPAGVEKIGVFVDADFGEIVRSVEDAALTGVQLHAAKDETLATKLRERFGASLRILRVLHFADDLEAQLQAVRNDNAIDGILVDSRTANAVGGTGVSYNWQAARAGFLAASRLRLIAAGGLKPENVAEAIRVLEPWGVDVASGVEAAPGKKDAARVQAFIKAANEAARELTVAAQ